MNKSSKVFFLSICIGLLAGCATERHPGPLGGVGDFLEDTPGATIVLALIIMAIIGGAARKK